MAKPAAVRRDEEKGQPKQREAQAPEQRSTMIQPQKKKLQMKEWQALPKKPRRTTSERGGRAAEKEDEDEEREKPDS